MTITAFFVDALGSALELGVATPDDVLKHATPDVLAAHLPRPEWAKLIKACLAAPRVDARLVVDTITVRVLCEHVPNAIVWACLTEVGQRALGKSILAPPPKVNPSGVVTATPPTGTPVVSDSGAVAVAVPAPATATATASQTARTSTLRMGAPARTDTPPVGIPAVTPRASSPAIGADEPPPLGAPPASRLPTSPLRTDAAKPGPSPAAPLPGNGIRSTGAGASTRRPQAQATPLSTRPASRTTPPPMRRPTTSGDIDIDIDTDMGSDWKKPDPLAVDDEQLVDWAQADETSTNSPPDRKR